MAELGLNAVNKEMVLDFLKFSRYKRTRCLKDVESAFSDVVESRLLEETFTSDEVKEILDGLCAVLKADMGSDLIHSSHTSALLLRQLFQQAEQWHLKLKVDLSELESGELLEKIAHFEEQELSLTAGSTSLHKHQQLDPLNSMGGEKLLQMEIDRLKSENSDLRCRLQMLEAKATDALTAKDQLQEDLLIQQSSPIPKEDSDTSGLQQKISDLQFQLTKARSKTVQSSSDPALDKALESTKHKLLRVTAELEETKKELQRKFNETTQYVNMRKMMETKTATIQALRAQLKENDQ